MFCFINTEAYCSEDYNLGFENAVDGRPVGWEYYGVNKNDIIDIDTSIKKNRRKFNIYRAK